MDSIKINWFCGFKTWCEEVSCPTCEVQQNLHKLNARFAHDDVVLRGRVISQKVKTPMLVDLKCAEVLIAKCKWLQLLE